MAALPLSTFPTSVCFLKKQSFTNPHPKMAIPSLGGVGFPKFPSSRALSCIRLAASSFAPIVPVISHESEDELEIVSAFEESSTLLEYSTDDDAPIDNNIIIINENPLVKSGNKNAIEVGSDGEGAWVRLDMPGVAKEGLKAWFEGAVLKVEGVEYDDKEEEVKRAYGFSVELPEFELLKKDQAKGVMENGVLKVVVPKLKFEERIDVVHINIV